MVKTKGNIWEVVVVWGLFLGFTLFSFLFVYTKEPQAIYPLLIPIVLLVLVGIVTTFNQVRGNER